MSIIFVAQPSQVAEHADNGKIYLNTSMRPTDKGETLIEIKVSALSGEIPVICIIQSAKIEQYSAKLAEAKDKAAEYENQMKVEFEAVGFEVFQGVVSEGNSQRFSIPVQEVIEDKKLKKTPKKRTPKE